MPDEPKPTSLKDELERMTRDATPALWLKDAYDHIEAWRTTMPGTDRIKFSSKLNADEPQRLLLFADNGWHKVDAFAIYETRRGGGVSFEPDDRFALNHPRAELVSEDEFVGHLLKVLRGKLLPRR